MQTCRLAYSVTVPLLIFFGTWAIDHGNADPHPADSDINIKMNWDADHWCNASSGTVPEGAVAVELDQEIFYVGRAEHEGGLIPGMVKPSDSVCYFSWGGEEHTKSQYQVLCNCKPKWVEVMDGVIPPNAIEVGHDPHGYILYTGRCHHKGALVLGSISELDNTLFILHDGQAFGYGEFEILVSE